MDDIPQKVQILKWYYSGNSVSKIKDLLSEAFPDRPSFDDEAIIRVVRNFEQYGCVSPPCHEDVSSPNTEMQELFVCAAIEENPTQTLVEVADQLNLDRRIAFNILKKHGYKYYRVVRMQELSPEDHTRRMEFCEYVLEMANSDENFIRNILFTGVSTFPLQFQHDPAVVHCWSREEPDEHFITRTQYAQKLNVWAGILDGNIIGPFFIDFSLDDKAYLEVLRRTVIPAVRNMREAKFDQTWYQHDNFPGCNTAVVQEYLAQTFPNRVIGELGTRLWPPRSSDLAPCEFFLWTYVKSRIYESEDTNYANFDELRSKIVEVFGTIKPAMLGNVRTNFYNRIGFCLAQKGGLFENLL